MTRREHKISTSGYGYNQNGLVCTIETLQPSTTAYQRFLRTGPVAMLPLWGNYSSIVWTCPPDKNKALKDLSDKQFCDDLNNVFHSESDVSWLGGFLPQDDHSKPPLVTGVSSERYSFPLSLSYANSLTSYRMALVGDAAHRIHPLAGQGLNLGLTDVAYLSNTLIKAKNGGADIGHSEYVLQEYDTLAQANASAVIASIEFVRNMYTPKFAGSEGLAHIVSLARNIGVDVIGASDFQKHNFISFASGNYTHPAKYEW